MTLSTLDEKSAIGSVGIWGGLLVLVPQAADLLHELALVPGLPPHVVGIVSSVGAILAIIGRYAATKKIVSVV